IVNAIIESPKGISHLNFDLISSSSENPNLVNTEGSNYLEKWNHFYQGYTYFRTIEGVSQEQLNNKLKQVSEEVNTIKKGTESTFDYRSQKIGDIMFSDEVYNPIGS